MESNAYERKLKRSLIISLAVGLVLLITGVLFRLLEVHVIENNKALIAVSFIPLGLAFAFIFNLVLLKRNPKSMRPIMVAEVDERLAALKHRADSIAFQVMRYTLTLLFFVYTFAYPSQVFESPGWWIVFGFFFLAHLLQPVILKFLMNQHPAPDDEGSEE